MKHRNIYVHSSDLIDLLMESMSDSEIAYAMSCDTHTTTDDDGDLITVVDPDCWYMASWPEHVINARYNSDATYHKVSEDDVRSIVLAHSSIHADSCRRANDLA